MREVEVERFVAATPAQLETHCSPATVVESEGTFTVVDAREDGEEAVVTARAGGMSATFAFEERDEGVHYVQRGAEGPFDAMETTITWTREDEGCRVTARSSVSLGLPLAALTDRVGAWKRKGELRRLLDRIAEALA